MNTAKATAAIAVSTGWARTLISSLLISLACHAPAIAATGDALPPQPVGHSETFSGCTIQKLEANYRLGISPWPNQINTRTHVASGEKQVWTGGNFLGLGIQPLYCKGGVLRLKTAPLPAAALPLLADRADQWMATAQARYAAATAAVDTAKITDKPGAQAAADAAKGSIPKAVWISNIKAERWSSGALASVTPGGLGYYAVRAKISSVPGRWFAFYLADWMRGLEIDINEAIGEKGQGKCYRLSVHSPYAPTQTALFCNKVALSKDFHEFGVLLTPDKKVVGYFDRVEWARLDLPVGSSKVINGKAAQWNWVLQTAVGGNWLENPAFGVSNKPKAGSSSVDYIDAVVRP